MSFNTSRQEAVCIYLYTVQAPSGTSYSRACRGCRKCILTAFARLQKVFFKLLADTEDPVVLTMATFSGWEGESGRFFFKLHLKLPWDMMLREEKLLGSNSKKDKEK